MIETVLNLFFPERCRGCGVRGSALCRNCKGHLPLSEPIQAPPYALALYDYGNAIVRQAVWELKYQRKSSVMKMLVMDNPALYIEWTEPIYIVPVPQHYTKTIARGFNQSEIIARWMTNSIPGSTYYPVLRKVRRTEAQSHTTSRTQRQKNLKHSTTVKHGQELSRTALYILVDDVITTGSTVYEASRALRAAGAKHIRAIAVAHGYAPR